MAQVRRIAPMNSLFFIGGGGPFPLLDFAVGEVIAAAPDGIAVGVLMCFDGETQITFGLAAETALDRPPDFDGSLNTPIRAVLVSTVEGENIFVQIGLGIETRVRIWLNRRQEPDEVVIGLG